MAKKIVVTMHTHDPKCKYKNHKVAGGVFDVDLLAPKGICLDAYASAYPYCLSLMYGARFEFMPDPNTITFQCPSPLKPVVMEARRVQIEERKLKVMIKVANVMKLDNVCEEPEKCKKCPMRVGMEFEFNHMGQCSEICPAGFIHIFPYMTALANGGTFPWATGPRSFIVHCPDEKINVSYEVTLKE